MRFAPTCGALYPGQGLETDGEDWFGFIFPRSRASGERQWKRMPEGHASKWIEAGSSPFVTILWEGDRHFLPLLFDRSEASPFHGVMPYRDGRPISWSFSRNPA